MGSLVLQVFGQRAVEVHLLPERGVVSIGRTTDHDVAIDDPSISRQHARLHVAAELEIEDLGSKNGCTVRRVRQGGSDASASAVEARVGKRERARFSPGDMVLLGSVVLAVRPRASGREQPSVKIETQSIAEPARAGVVLEDPAMRRVYELARRLAVGDVSILLLGETGVGKDVLARAIHEASPRASGPLVRLNCAALAEQLLESELFGHEKGAFTGAVATKPGLLESAHGGTVFLDEVGELPLTTQAKLLRVLEAGEVLRVGALKPRAIDVRFVAATNRDLSHEVARGSFRKDLYFRLNGVSLVIPPLRQRRGELRALVASMLGDAARRLARPVPRVDPAAMAALDRHSWPGNLRELRNVIERSLLLCQGGVITADLLHLEQGLAGGPGAVAEVPAVAAPAPAAAAPPGRGGVRDELLALERERMIEALERCAGNQTQAAEALGMSRRTFVKKLVDHDIPRPRSAPRK
ncbi:MAG: sigma 54-interacting transcriptional regulator [Deltaproteobacteria bacterium]|nr:sigma 54-interacting transcriptional regulator [Deltaproteobacteria bacterium]